MNAHHAAPETSLGLGSLPHARFHSVALSSIDCVKPSTRITSSTSVMSCTIPSRGITAGGQDALGVIWSPERAIQDALLTSPTLNPSPSFAARAPASETQTATDKNATEELPHDQPQARDAAGVAVSGSAASPVSFACFSSRLPSLRATRLIKGLHKKLEGRPAWRTFNRHEKTIMAMAVAYWLGGYAFTLRFSSQHEISLASLPDRGESPCRRQSGYLQRAFREALGYVPAFAFFFEFSPTGALHLHGVLLPRNEGEEHLKVIRTAMREAGGEILGRSGSTQAHCVPLFDGLGWGAYSTKSLKRTRHLLGHKHVDFVSQDLSRQTRNAYEAFRAQTSMSSSSTSHALAIILPGVRVRLSQSATYVSGHIVAAGHSTLR